MELNSQRFQRLSFAMGALLVMGGSPALAANWGKIPLKNDGRAEVAFYDSAQLIDGKSRSFKEQLLITSEDLREDSLVGTDNRKAHKTIPAFRLNVVQQVDLENYPVRSMVSVFVKTRSPEEALKITAGSQDWVGTTFKIYAAFPDKLGGELRWFSPYDGEADQVHQLDQTEEDLFEDQLPLTLRALSFKVGEQKKVRLWPSLAGRRAAPPEPEPGVISVTGEEVVRSRAGSLPCWMVTVKRGGQEDNYWFEKKSPHLLVKMKTSDGRERLLTGHARWSFWDPRFPKPNHLY